jgi:lactonase family protein with 7-bladed beta-propeller
MRRTACVLAATVGALAWATAAQSGEKSGRKQDFPEGIVYVQSNIGAPDGQNSILAYQRDADGRLTKIGEYPTGGTGVHPIESTIPTLPTTLGPLDSDQEMLLSKDGRHFFAVNGGSDTIAAFDVKGDGSLVPVKGSPYPCGGVNPSSLGFADDEKILVVVNKDYDLTRPGFDVSKRAPNYTTFRVNGNGRLERVTKSDVSAGAGGGLGPGNPVPTQALVVPGGRIVFDTDLFGYTLHSFRVERNGRLERVASHTLPASEFVPHPLIPRPEGLVVPLGLAAHPTERVVYAGEVLEGRVAVLSYDEDGDFEFVRSADAGAGICWITMNASGNRMYTTNTLAQTVSVLDSSDPLNPVELQEFVVGGPPSGPVQLTLDAANEYLYVVSQKTLDFFPPDANALHVFRLAADGTIAAQTDRVVIPVTPSSPQGVIAR